MQTDKATDLYISGEGYFVVRDAVGEVSYTRVGRFGFDEAGNLVDASGNHVVGVNGATAIPAYNPSSPIALSSLANINVDLDLYSNIAIGQDGVITGLDSAGATQILGQIALAGFANPDGLTQEGTMYMKESGNSGSAVYSPAGVLLQELLLPADLKCQM
jgi:flagellar hook protein FlgE